jgi:hypothetical protein
MARLLQNGGLGPDCVVDASVMLDYYGITRSYGEVGQGGRQVGACS